MLNRFSKDKGPAALTLVDPWCVRRRIRSWASVIMGTGSKARADTSISGMARESRENR
jgi:hypothetical protein